MIDFDNFRKIVPTSSLGRGVEGKAFTISIIPIFNQFHVAMENTIFITLELATVEYTKPGSFSLHVSCATSRMLSIICFPCTLVSTLSSLHIIVPGMMTAFCGMSRSSTILSECRPWMCSFIGLYLSVPIVLYLA
jgi:hypothetical protein